MTGERPTCPEGWRPAEILSYLDDEMEPTGRAAFKQHLSGCSVCSSELESLRRIAGLLEAHPEALHPDEHELYELVFHGRDPEGRITQHIRSCADCTEDAALLRLMVAARSALPDPRPVMPEALAVRLERTFGHIPSRKSGDAFFSRVLQRLGFEFRAPMLAVGTAAALVVVAILGIPLWKTYVGIPQPGLEFEAGRIDQTRRALPGAIEPRPAERDGGRARVPAASSELREEEAPPAKDRPLPSTVPTAQPQFGPRDPVPAGEEAPDPRRIVGTTEPGETRSLSGTPRRGQPRRFLGKTEQQGLGPERKEKRSGLVPQAPVPPVKLEPSLPQAPPKGEARPALPSSAPRQLSTSGPLVTVQIRGAAESGVPELKFIPPQALVDRFVFVEEQGRKADASRPEAIAEQSPRHPAEESPRAGFLVVFHVAAAGDAFDLTADLFEDGSALPKKSVNAAKVKKNDLEATLGGLATGLLAQQ